MNVNMAMVNDLKSFCDNGGLVDKNRPPLKNEPFYSDYIKSKIEKMKIKPGDKLRLKIKEYDSGKQVEVEGVNVTRTRGQLSLLTKGKKVWQNRSNLKCFDYSEIVDIEKLENAAANFDLEKVLPWAYTPDEDNDFESYRKDETEIGDCDRRYIKEKFANADFRKQCFLNIEMSVYGKAIYESYGDDKARKHMSVDSVKVLVLRGDEIEEIDNIVMKNIYPNKNYVSVTDKGKDRESILLAFESFNDLSSITSIASIWSMHVDDEIVKYIDVVRTKFAEPKGESRIYNIESQLIPMEFHAEGLHTSTVFSGRIYSDYVFAAIVQGDVTMPVRSVLSDKDEKEFVKPLCSLLSKESSYNEIYVADEKMANKATIGFIYENERTISEPIMY